MRKKFFLMSRCYLINNLSSGYNKLWQIRYSTWNVVYVSYDDFYMYIHAYIHHVTDYLHVHVVCCCLRRLVYLHFSIQYRVIWGIIMFISKSERDSGTGGMETALGMCLSDTLPS